MALSKTIVVSGKANLSQNGLSASQEVSLSDSVYIKVSSVNATKESASASVQFKGENLSGTKTYDFVPDMSGVNFIKQAYLHLKTLPEFDGAKDC